MSAYNPSIYDSEFLQRVAEGSKSSAKVIVPLVMELLGPKPISSVVDVGCGLGYWLAEFRNCGVSNILGMDGGSFDESLLAIPPGNFRRVNLVQEELDPCPGGVEFALALSLEVAEHLSPSSAEAYIGRLCGLAKTILFSAAIPGQTGRGHINEQWPEYWSARFDAKGYVPVDCVRPSLSRNDHRVKYWYAQNTFIYVQRKKLGQYPRLKNFQKATHKDRLSWVHPVLYERQLRKLRTFGHQPALDSSKTPGNNRPDLPMGR